MAGKDSEAMHSLLLSIRDCLLRFRTKPCNLVHEKVTAVAIFTSLENDNPAPSYTFSRSGFCPAESRKWLLNCAHSMAAANFKYQLAQLENTGLFTPGTLPTLALNQVLAEIYSLDHQIGEVEKRIALLRYTEGKESDLQELHLLRNQIQKKHRSLVLSLNLLLQKIIAAIDLVLRELNASHPTTSHP